MDSVAPFLLRNDEDANIYRQRRGVGGCKQTQTLILGGNDCMEIAKDGGRRSERRGGMIGNPFLIL